MTDDRRGVPTAHLSRQGGWLGVAAVPLNLLGLALGAESDDPSLIAETVELVASFASLCFVVGLVARHSHYRWPRWCLAGFVLGLAAGIIGAGMYDNGVPGGVLMAGSAGAFLVGVFLAGIVPRAAVLLLAAAIATVIAGLDVPGAVLWSAAMAWLGYALWREPEPAGRPVRSAA